MWQAKIRVEKVANGYLVRLGDPVYDQDLERHVWLAKTFQHDVRPVVEGLIQDFLKRIAKEEKIDFE